MTSSDIRQSFLDFFKEKQHTIVPSSPLLPDAPNLLFTNAGMNQFVPIFLGQAPCPYRPARAANTQKCIRAGGKHNDLEDVGFDTYHHTFFEMLGNWSFGDYFKKEAIAWAWELVVGRWNFPASRLYATVYQPGPGDPAGFDREAHDAWAAIFTRAGLDPALHIVNGNKKDNFWMMGDTGPCGPCSELHVDLTPGPRDLPVERQKSGRDLVNQGDARCIEIWNLVFIQFNANPDGTFGELPAKHVDTGMGFERVVSIIQGTDGLKNFESGKISNYETDVFRPIFDELEKLTGKKYASTLPASAQNETEQEKIDVAFRVIADHVRTLSFSIADGIIPGNTDRNYVLRRILRRAVSYGREVGCYEPFLYDLVGVVARTMGDVFPEVRKKEAGVKAIVRDEEVSFNRTLDAGMYLFNEAVHNLRQSKSNVLPGDIAFKLHDTHGFPIDLTQLKARECDLTVDVDEFDRLMEEQKARGKAAQKKERIEVFTEGDISTGVPHTKFIGYDKTSTITGVVLIEKNFVATRETPFYAEMGGQVGDTGKIKLIMADQDAPEQIYTVEKTIRSGAGGTVLHKIKEVVDFPADTAVTLEIDQPRRAKIEAHHSATHLMHWALRKVLGPTVTQKGSYVGPDRLRFDFSHGGALTPAELAEVEKLVNEKIGADLPVSWNERPYAEVKGDPSILQFFGDKYGDTVRVVSIGDFSRELCGGTHVRQSGRIGYFKILSEGAIAAGIRRIEVASGAALVEHVREQALRQDEQYAALRLRKPGLGELASFAGAETPEAFWQKWETREAALRHAAADVAQHEKEEARHHEALFQKRAKAEAEELVGLAQTHGAVPILVHTVTDISAVYLTVLADALKTRWPGVVVLAAITEEKVALLCAVPPEFTKKIQAGKIIQAIAPLVGGKGGGRPELAQGGGNNPAGVPEALEKAEELVAACGKP